MRDPKSRQGYFNALDRATAWFAPVWTAKRLAARVALRHYEAASTGRRTVGWSRTQGDVNAITKTAINELRMHARDLRRNNGWAKRGVNTIARNTVGWGIVPAPTDRDPKLSALWKSWANSTQCDAEGLRSFYGLEAKLMKAVATDGESLVRRRWRDPKDGLILPMQLQLLESDFLDNSHDTPVGPSGGPVIQGVEFDFLGRRVGYWLFPEHPGAVARAKLVSKRVDASEILHVFDDERCGQVRGVSWLATAILNLKDLDEYEDGELLKQKVAAAFAAFVTDDGSGSVGGDEDADDTLESFDPGSVNYLAPGKKVDFSNPPTVTEGSFAQRNLRKIAAGLDVTYEDLTGDYTQVNYSSARMARLAHWAAVWDWRENMLIPKFCNPAWAWFMEAAQLVGVASATQGADWTAPPMPMIEPDKEGLAIQRLVRNGVKTPGDVVREQGGDFDEFLVRYSAEMKAIRAADIVLDSDAKSVSQAGLTQQRVGLQKGSDTSDPTQTASRAEEDVSEFERIALEDAESEVLR